MAYKFIGLKELQGKLKELPKTIEQRIDGEIKATVLDINGEQVARAPINAGELRRKIGWDETGKMQYELFSLAPYSAYVEFGTGALVDMPSGLEDYAMQFKGKGIKQVNLPARPYFFSPFLSEKEALLKRIKAIISKI